MKLTAFQIGQLALICEAICRRFPEPGTEILMEPWEVALKEAVDANPLLPNYDEKHYCLHLWIEVFMNYDW